MGVIHTETTMNKLLATLLALALSGCATPGVAGTLATLSIIDRSTGERLQTYHHRGRLWIAGTPGNKYAVAVDNTSGQRVMTVVSVDGVNVVTGETAAPMQNGYVLDGGMHYEITGWRKSANEVAAFVFTALPDSYAARTDRPGNVGVIGMAVYREWNPPRPATVPQPRPFSHSDALSHSRSEDSAARSGIKDAPASAGASSEAAAKREMARTQPEERLGTGHGEREGSQVGYTHFRRANDRPNEVLAIYYDSYANLVARGVIRPSHRNPPAPVPFPGDTRFVPDPRG